MSHINKVVVIDNLENPTEAQDRILRGANFLANSLKLTIGPYGKNFLLEKGLKITNDGFSIAKELTLKDEIEDLGLRYARHICEKTNTEVGDFTTTVAVLFQAILKEILRLLPGKNLVGKKSIIQIRKQMDEELALVSEKLKAMSIPVKDEEDLIGIAKTSTQDDELAKLIGGTQWKLGNEGVLLAEETNDMESSVEIVSGIRFDNGLGTTLVLNDQENQRLDAENVSVIMTNFTFDNFNAVKGLWELMIKNGTRKIAVIGRGFTDRAIKTCMENMKLGIEIYPLNAPYVNQREIMRDLASVLGGKYYDTEESDLESMQVSDVGFAEKIVAGRFSAILTGRKSEENDKSIKKRIEELEKSLKGEESVFIKKQTKERISQLKNGLAIVKVGSTTEDDRKYKYDKAEDAVHTVKNALSDGVVRGAGLAMKEISESLPEDSILKRPLLVPYQEIMHNAGEDFGVEDWVKNPVKGEITALKYACQIAVNLATAGGSVASERPKTKYMQVEDKGE